LNANSGFFKRENWIGCLKTLAECILEERRVMEEMKTSKSNNEFIEKIMTAKSAVRSMERIEDQH